jgi:multicomponent Na+:H+ antiporter subunit F
VAVDMLGIVVIGFCVVLSLASRDDILMDIAIAWTLQSYIGVVALAKYLEGKHFDE